MSDEFMNFLEGRRTSYIKSLQEIEDYQMKYATTVLELFQQISLWMEPYEKEGYLHIEEKLTPQPHNDRLSELVLHFESREEIYLRPDFSKLPLDKPFTITINLSTKDNRRLETTLIYHQNEGWFILNRGGIGFGKDELLKEELFKTIIKEKLENK